MSSSSLCECDCYTCKYGERTVCSPLYPTMGHPLVYYAQVDNYGMQRQRNRERRKDNPNCFVKAYRWYTQEHVPQSQHLTDPSIANRNVMGFADWLDAKYNQFLWENDHDAGLCHVKLTETSIFKADTMFNDVDQPCKPKRFARIRRSWKKRSVRPSNNEEGDIIETANKSVIYILEPKELERPLSAYCQPTTSSCCSMSPASRKSVAKSQSATNASKNNETKSGLFDEAHPPEGAKMNKKLNKDKRQKSTSVKNDDVECQCDEGFMIKDDTGTQCECDVACSQSATKEKIMASSKPNVTDQGPKIESPKAPISLDHKDIETSPETKDPSPCLKCICLGCTPAPVQKTKPANKTPPIAETAMATKNYNESRKFSNFLNSVSCQYSESLKAAQKHSIESQCTVPNSCKETMCNSGDRKKMLEQLPQPAVMVETAQSRRCLTCQAKMVRPTLESAANPSLIITLVNETAQTSDHSISLDADSIHAYPLFMRVVCADKLDDGLYLPKECMHAHKLV